MLSRIQKSENIGYLAYIRNFLVNWTSEEQMARIVQIFHSILVENFPNPSGIRDPDILRKKIIHFCQEEYRTNVEDEASIPTSYTIEENTVETIFKKLLRLDQTLYPNVADSKLTIVYKKILAAQFLFQMMQECTINFYFFLDNTIIKQWKELSSSNNEVLILNKSRRKLAIRWNMVPSVTGDILWLNDEIKKEFQMKPAEAATWLAQAEQGYQLLKRFENQRNIHSLIESYCGDDLTLKKITFLHERMELAQDLRLQTHICQMVLYCGSNIDFSKKDKSSVTSIQHEVGTTVIEAAHTTIVRETPLPTKVPDSVSIIECLAAMFNDQKSIIDNILSFVYPVGLERVVARKDFSNTLAANQIGITVGMVSLINHNIDNIFFDEPNPNLIPTTVQIARNRLDAVSKLSGKKPNEATQDYLARSIESFLKEMNAEMVRALAYFDEVSTKAEALCSGTAINDLRAFSKLMATRPRNYHAYITEAMRLEKLLQEYENFISPKNDDENPFRYLTAYSHITAAAKPVGILIERLKSFIDFPKKFEQIGIIETEYKANLLSKYKFDQKEDAYKKSRELTEERLLKLDSHINSLVEENKKILDYFTTVRICTKIYQEQTAHYCRPDIVSKIFPDHHREEGMDWLEYHRTQLWQSAALRTSKTASEGIKDHSGVILSFKRG